MAKVTDKDVVDIINAYSVLLVPMIQIAKQYAVTRQCIFKILRKSGIDTSKATAAHIAVSCTVCGKETVKVRCQFRNANHHFCSEDCYFAWLKHGNGKPFIVHRHGTRQARDIVSKIFPLRPGHIVHHEDRNQFNNNLENLRVFANQGDHIRYHRGFLSSFLWDGSMV